MSAARASRPRRKGFERLLLASLIALLAGCGTPKAGGKDVGAKVALTPEEHQLVAAWKAERGLSEGDALSNVMLRRYSAAGHKVRYAGEGLYEVLDRPGATKVVATFFVQGVVK
jgi:hypothetical protein